MNAVAAHPQQHAGHWLTALLGALLALGLLALALDYFGDRQRFPVARVDVEGELQYADRERIQALIANYSSDGFYRLDIAALQTALEQQPWVAQTTVRRLWPERIAVAVAEREPQARWGEAGLLGRNAELFYPHQLAAENDSLAAWREHFSRLPLVFGEQGREAVLLTRLQHYQAQLTPLGVTIDALREDNRRAVQLTLGGGVEVLLGRRELDQRMARLVRIYARFVAADETVERVDLRYTNGFAISRAKPADVPTGGE